MREPELRRVLSALAIQIAHKTHSGWLEASCPFAPWLHSRGMDASPSFGAKVEDGGVSSYYCAGCKMHGRISSLARALGHYRHGNVTHFAPLAMWADDADRSGLVVGWADEVQQREVPPDPIVEEVYANMFEPAEASVEALSYLAGRGIGVRTAVSLGLRYDARQRRVVFPVRGRDGRCFGFTGRALDPGTHPKVRDYAGLKKRWHILGAERWRQDERPLVIVEGLFGLAHLVESNLEAVADVGALLGSSLTEQKADLIKQRNTRTFLLVDNDEAGEACLFGRLSPDGSREFDGAAVSMLQHHVPLFIPAWPEGKDDPDQLTKQEQWDILRFTAPWGIGQPVAGWV